MFWYSLPHCNKHTDTTAMNRWWTAVTNCFRNNKPYNTLNGILTFMFHCPVLLRMLPFDCPDSKHSFAIMPKSPFRLAVILHCCQLIVQGKVMDSYPLNLLPYLLSFLPIPSLHSAQKLFRNIVLHPSWTSNMCTHFPFGHAVTDPLCNVDFEIKVSICASDKDERYVVMQGNASLQHMKGYSAAFIFAGGGGK
jgi:hypothetical protein